MPVPAFFKLNHGWNAEPNAPDPRVDAASDQVRLSFDLNPYAYVAEEEKRGILTFASCQAWRRGPTNVEGWYRGQCRYSQVAPAWGNFYELSGEDDLQPAPQDWTSPPLRGTGERHFLFYLRDETFECLAADWSLTRVPPA